MSFRTNLGSVFPRDQQIETPGQDQEAEAEKKIQQGLRKGLLPLQQKWKFYSIILFLGNLQVELIPLQSLYLVCIGDR